LAGLLRTLLVEVSTSALQHPNPPRHLSCTACRKGRSSGRFVFVLYVPDVLQLVKDHGLMPHAYADNTQILGICCPSESEALQNRVSDCLDAVGSRMAANWLLVNNDKTEALWCSSLRRQHQIPTRPVRVGSASVQPVATVRNLGVYLDADATMRAHVTSTVRACFAILRQINSVRQSLTRPALITLLLALVISKLDYCNSVLAGAPAVLLSRFQSVLNAAARLGEQICSHDSTASGATLAKSP